MNNNLPLIIIESLHADEIQRRVAALDGYSVHRAQALPASEESGIRFIVFMVKDAPKRKRRALPPFVYS